MPGYAGWRRFVGDGIHSGRPVGGPVTTEEAVMVSSRRLGMVAA